MRERINSHIKVGSVIKFFLYSITGPLIIALLLYFGFGFIKQTEALLFKFAIGLAALLIAYFSFSYFMLLFSWKVLFERIMVFGLKSKAYEEGDPNSTFISVLSFYERYIGRTFILLIYLWMLIGLWKDTVSTAEVIYVSLATFLCLIQFSSYRYRTSEKYLLSKVANPFFF